MWRFLREMVSELKKVTWPKFPKVLKQTGIVLLVVLVFLLVLTGIDSLLAWLLSLLVRI
jgi:preprotein translocase SecE subunit